MSDSKVTRAVVITNRQGLHARAALMVTKEARRFNAQIELVKDGERAATTDLLHVMALGAQCGDEVFLEADGPEAQDAIEALAELITNKIRQVEDGPGA